MKQTIRYGVAVVVAGVSFLVSVPRNDRTVPRPSPVGAFEGTGEDVEARHAYERTLLRDPATGEIPPGISVLEQKYARTLPSREETLRKTGGSAAVTWSSRGPSNVGGRTRAFGIDVTNANILLAGCVSGGMWRSSDGGTSWTKTTVPAALHSVTCLAQDTRAGQTGTWYYGTGEYRGNSASGGAAAYSGDGIYKSTDNGLTWNPLPSTVSGTPHQFDQYFDYVWNVATDPSSSQQEVYAATTMAVLRSTDGGTSWSPVRGSYGNASPRFTDVAVTSNGVVYAVLSSVKLDGTTGATAAGIYRSTDGITWTNITPGTFPATYGRIVLSIAPSNQNIVYFLVHQTSGTDGVNQINGHQFWKYTYLTGDGSGAGGTWENRGVNLPNESGLASNAVFDTYSAYVMVIRVKPDNPDFVVLGAINLYRSTDGFATGSNWTRIGGYAGPGTYTLYANQHPDHHSGQFLPGNPQAFVSGHDGGLSKTTSIAAPTVSWSFLNNGYVTAQFYTIALDNATAGNAVVIGGTQDNGSWWTSTTNASTPWTAQFGGDGAGCAVADGRSSYYMSTQNGVVYRLVLNATGGLTDYARVDPTGASGYLFISPLALDPSDTRIMYLPAGSNLWRNSNLTAIPTYTASPGSAGNTTTVNWTNLTSAAVTGSTITAVGVSTVSPQYRLYYGTNDGKVFRLDNANTATSSTTPTDVWTGKGLPAGAYVSSIAVDPTNGNTALVVFSNYGVVSLFLTTDGGATWTAVAGNLEQFANGSGNGPSCRTAVIVPYAGSTTVFVGTSTGLYSTQTLNGSSTVWSQEGTSVIGNVVVASLAARRLDGTVVVGTHGRGAFSGTLPTTGIEEPAVPVQTALLPNYPNPFNPSTTIRFRLSRSGPATVAVYSIQGERVATLLNGVREAGEHQVVWEPRGVASGAYVCRLEAGTVTQSRKILYVR